MASGSLLRSARPLVAGRATSALIGFALPVVLARSLDQASYGTYKQLFLIAFLMMHSLQLGLSQALFYFLPRAATEREQRAYLGQAQILLGLVGAASGAALLALAPTIAQRFQNPQLQDIALPLSLLSASLIASAGLEVALTARGKPRRSALALVSTDAIRVVGMIGPVLLGHGIEGLAWGAALAGVLRWMLSAATAYGEGALSFNRDTLTQHLAYALPFGFAVLLAMPQQQLHQILVASRATPEHFALYAVGCMQIPVVALLYMPVSETLQVRLARLEREGRTHEAGEVFSEAVDRLAMIFLPLCALLIAVARPLLELLYGAAYAAAAPIFQVAVLSVVVASLPVDGVLKARARTQTLLVANAIKLAVTWPVLSLGWSAFGMRGAIGGHIALELLTKLCLLQIVARELKSPVTHLIAPSSLVRSTAVSIAACAAGLTAADFTTDAFAGCVLGGGTAGLVLGVPIVGRWRNRRLLGAKAPPDDKT